MLRRFWTTLCFFAAILSATPSQAAIFNWHLGAGLGLSAVGQTQDITFADNNTNRYTADEDHLTSLLLNIGGGFTYKVTYWLHIYAGLDMYYIRMSDVSGVMKPLINSPVSLCDYNYNFNVSSIPFLLHTRIIIPTEPVQSYLIAGIGLSWNRASSYSEVPTDPDSGSIGTMSPFSSGSERSFAFDVGLGFKGHISKTISAALEYHFMHLGEARLGVPPGQPETAELSSGDINIHAIILKLVFGDS